MNRSHMFIPCICMLLFITIDIYSQTEEDEIINAWLEVGSLRFAPTEKESSTGVDVAFKYQRNKLLTYVQYHDYIDKELAHGGFELFTDRNKYHAGNILIGITNKKCRVGHVSISSGVGIFWGEFEDIGVEKFATVGWPVEAAASLNFCSFVGINMKLFTNINLKHSLVGFGMDLQLGKLRKLKPIKVRIPVSCL